MIVFVIAITMTLSRVIMKFLTRFSIVVDE